MGSLRSSPKSKELRNGDLKSWLNTFRRGAGGGLLTGLAWLGVAQIAGEGVTKDGQSAESQAAAHEGFVALTAAEEAFGEVQND